MTILPLGTNGFFPSFGRHTACYLLPYGDTLIILDAGSGLFRLAEPSGKQFLQKAEKIHLYLSHYHLDHTFGFYAAFNLLAGQQVTVFGKEKRKVFAELTKLDYFPIDFVEKYGHFRWKKLEEGTHNMDSYQVAVRRQHHRGHGSLAFRFTLCKRRAFAESLSNGPKNKSSNISPPVKTLAYVTDSEPVNESIQFIKGSDLLLHEHGYSGKELAKKGAKRQQHIVDGHVTTIGAALIAKEAGVKKLVLIHHPPFISSQRLKKDYLPLSLSVFPNSALGEDKVNIKF